jgi:TorA maturation chaperone TorD
MTNREKGHFCGLAASLLAPPDGELLKELKKGGIQSLLQEIIREWGGNSRILAEFSPEKRSEDFLPALQREYAHLFNDFQGAKISLVESTYKPWTKDSGCTLAFAGNKGLLLGDCALHMRDMFHQLSLDVPEEFRSTPDHLVLELEFLSLLYQSATPEQVQTFIKDHLDWIPHLKDRIDRADPHIFYRNAIEFINLFLEHEGNEGKAKIHGAKNFH